MKRIGRGWYRYDTDEPAMRSCWECNPAHEHLRHTEFLHVCFECGRYWIHGRYLDSFESLTAMDIFLVERLEHDTKDGDEGDEGAFTCDYLYKEKS